MCKVSNSFHNHNEKENENWIETRYIFIKESDFTALKSLITLSYIPLNYSMSVSRAQIAGR